MATVTSLVSGHWVADAASVWDTGVVPAAGDDIIIAAGDVVDYDCGVSTTQYNTVTINGELRFPTDADSKLEFNGTGTGITIGAAGIIRTGVNDGDYVDSDHKLQIFWQNGASGRYGWQLTDGGKIELNGDPAFYGSTRYSNFHDDWSAGDTFYVVGDVTGKWAAGQYLAIERFNATRVGSPHQTQIQTIQIESIGTYDAANDRTPITAVETSPPGSQTYYTGGYVINLTRNVEFGIEATTHTIYAYNANTENVRIGWAQGTTNTKISFKDVHFRGFNNIAHYSTTACFNALYTNCVVVNTNTALNYAYRNRLTDCTFFSNSNAASSGGENYHLRTFFTGSNFTFSSTTGNRFYDCKWLANYQASGQSFGTFYNPQIRQCYTGFLNYGHTVYGADIFCLDQLFFCAGTTTVNGGPSIIYGKVEQLGTVNNGQEKVLFHGTIVGSPTMSPTGATMCYPNFLVLDNTILNNVERAYRVYSIVGNCLPLITGDTHWQTPDSGNDWISEFVPTSRCAPYAPFVYSPLRQLAAYVTAGSKTITMKIYPGGFSASLTEDDIYLEAYYLDDADGMTRTRVITGDGTFAINGWRSLTVTFNPARDGIVHFNLYCTKYEASCYVLIDPVWSIA